MTDPLLAILGRRARAQRLARGLTLREVAERSGVSSRFLVQLEAGDGNISVRRLADVAAALDTTPSALLAADDAAPRIVALLGLRGAGKTTIGRRLAKRRRVPFVELDKRIEQAADLSLGEIFALHGEEYYRRLEREVLKDVLRRSAPDGPRHRRRARRLARYVRDAAALGRHRVAPRRLPRNTGTASCARGTAGRWRITRRPWPTCARCSPPASRSTPWPTTPSIRHRRPWTVWWRRSTGPCTLIRDSGHRDTLTTQSWTAVHGVQEMLD